MTIRRTLSVVAVAALLSGITGAASAQARGYDKAGPSTSATRGATTVDRRAGGGGGSTTGGTGTTIPTAPAPPVASNPFPGFASLSPAPGATRVALNVRALLQFTAYPTNASAATIVVTDPAGVRVPMEIYPYPVYGGAAPQNVVVVQPAGTSTLRANTTYRVTATGIVLQNGVAVPRASWTFTTGTGWQY
ncbi:MAG: Ig-like domain-containing protein [Phycicoccus sp.]|nr:Ig-like domain-containing protein [Phycicoccus sp.]